MKTKFVRFGTLLLLGLLGACNSSPTVPIPPPEFTLIIVSSPDVDGNVTVTGEPDSADDGDVVLVFNDDTGVGAMKEAAPDGSFEIIVEAEVNHIIVVQIKRDNRLSSEEDILVQ